MKTMKRFGCLLLVLAMCLALGVTAMADSPQTLASSADTQGSITINGAIANETYTIYQIFELTYTDYDTTDEDASPESYSYKVCEGWADFLATQTVNVDGNNVALFTLTNNGYLDPDSLIFSVDYDMAALAREALAYAQMNSIAGTSVSYTYDASTDTATLNPQDVATITNISTDENGYVTGELTFSNLSLGYYLVGTSLGSLCMLDSTDPDAIVNEKNGTPTVEKWVHENSAADGTWQHEDDAMNGDSILFEINISNINGADNLVLHDSMDSELHIADATNFHLNSIVLYTSESANGIILMEDTDYTISVGECTVEDCTLENCAFEVHFLRNFNDVDSTGYITLTYYLVLDTEGDSYENDFDEIDNYAQVTFATSSVSPEVMAETYSFGFEVYKYTGDLGDVETEYGTYYVFEDTVTHDGPEDVDNEFYFVATDGDYEYYAVMTELGNNSYIVTGWVDSEDNATSITEPQVATTFTIYVTESSMEALAALEGEPSVGSLLEDARFHLLEEGGNAAEQQDEDAIEYTMEYGTVPGTATPLANAVFEVSNSSNQTAYFLYEENLGIYLFEGWLDEGASLPADSVYTTSLTSASDGMIYIEGLDTGTYTVTEIAAPDGYNMLDDSIYVEIWAEYNADTGECTDYGVTWTLGSEEGEGIVNVENNAGSKLPGTGGIGTTIFYVIGAVLVCGAVVLLVTKRRANNKNEAGA